MKVIQINTTCGKGSTGRIAVSIATLARQSDIECQIVYGYGEDDSTSFSHRIQNHMQYILNNIMSRILANEGDNNYLSTKKLIRYLKKEKPDLIHLHNIHGHYINARLLFDYIKKDNVKVVWTLHDCWPFTGQCPHFTMAKCERWKTGCHNCSQYNNYPQALWDNSKAMWRKKKKWFSGVKNMIIITPSDWLAGLVKQSFLKDYPVKVINNGIDLSVFKPTESKFREQHNIKKYMILGVSFGWGIKKGLDVFCELSQRLPNDYSIVLVGTDEETEKKVPSNIICISRTNSAEELAAIYSAADVFVMPTREDTYPTVNMEAIACGTPVITFNTGGSPEIVDCKTGIVIQCDDIAGLESSILHVCNETPFLSNNCCMKAEKTFNQIEKFDEYVNLYKKVINDGRV